MNFRQLFENNKITTIRGPHGQLDVDRSEKGVTRVQRQNWRDTNSSGGADYEPTGKKRGPGTGTTNNTGGSGIPHPTGFSDVNSDWAARRRRPHLDRDDEFAEGAERRMPITDYDTWRDQVDAQGGEIHPQRDRNRLVAQSWSGETIGEFHMGTNQGYIIPGQPMNEFDVDEGVKGKIAGAALAAANLLSPAQAAEEPVKPITIAYVQIDGEVRKYNLGDKFSNAKEAEQFISSVLDKQGISGYTLDIKHGYPKQKTDEAGQGVVEATGDPKFDKMLKGITGKRQVAKQQKADTKQQARDAFGGMFGGGNPADSLGIRKKSVDEGKGDFAQAIENLHGWHEEESNNPDIRIWEFDDREGGYYAQGTVMYNTSTGRVKVKFEDKDGYHGGDVNDTFNSIGDAMNVLKNITVQIRSNTGKAQDFDKLGGRTVAGPDDLYKTDRAGKKGTLNKSRMDTMKASSPYRKTGPKGQLPEQGVAEGTDGYGYKSLSTEQIMKLIQSGNWEAVQDIVPGKHIQLRNNRNGKNTTVHVKQDVDEDSVAEGENWSKHKNPRVGGMSKKSVSVYRREHPGSKIQTAVTTKPSKLKKGSKAAKRRKSFCARMSGNKGPMKKPNGKPTPKALALRRWNCESIEELQQLAVIAEQKIQQLKEAASAAQQAAIAVNMKKNHKKPKSEELDENLRDWFKEKWVRFGPDGKIRGDCARGSESEGKPKCLPQAKAHALGKKGRASAAARKRREDPNANRAGAAINVATKKKTNEVQLDEKCWDTYKQVGMKEKSGRMVPNCVPKESQEQSEMCPECGGAMYSEAMINEKKDACYYKVKASAKVWPSAYASGRLVQCRKRGAASYGKKSESKIPEDMNENLRQLPPEVIDLLKKVAQSDAAPEHKAAIIKSIMAKYQPVKDIAEAPTRTAREKFNQGLKRAGFDPEAAAKRLTDLIAKQKAERERFEKENPTVYGDK